MGELSEFRKKGCLETYKSNGPLREHFPVKLENGATVHVVNGICGALRPLAIANRAAT